MSPQDPLPARPETQGCQLTRVRAVRLVNARQRDAQPLQTLGFERQVQLVAARQHDDVGVGVVRAVDRLANGVAQLRVAETDGQIAPDDQVMADGSEIGGCRGKRLRLGAPLRRDAVVGSSSTLMMGADRAAVNWYSRDMTLADRMAALKAPSRMAVGETRSGGAVDPEIPDGIYYTARFRRGQPFKKYKVVVVTKTGFGVTDRWAVWTRIQ